MKKWIENPIWFDLEANGLLEEKDGNPPADRIWCVSFTEENGDEHDFTLDGGLGQDLNQIREYILSRGNATFICHNHFGFDLELLRRLLNLEFGLDWWVSPDNRVRFFDTLDFSQRLWPDRPMPKGCPGSVYNPVTGKNKRIGAHGLEAYGYRVARAKPAIHDWRNGEIKDYLHRCKEDVAITRKVFYALMEEMEKGRLF